jgi:hypothetical protein
MKSLSRLLLSLVAFFLLAGCGSQKNPAASAVETYIQAMVAQNADKVTAASCADWEANAQMELDSFASVTVTLKDLSCQAAGTEGTYTLVKCTGKITANYNGEDQELNLADRTYQAINESGEWRMCGYR